MSHDHYGKHSVRYVKKVANDESSSDYNYWMGMRPGKLYAKSKAYVGVHYDHEHEHEHTVEHSHGHGHKEAIVVTKEPAYVEKVVKSYGIKEAEVVHKPVYVKRVSKIYDDHYY